MADKRITEFLRFGVTGAVATAIHYAVYFALMRWLEANVAFTIGYVVSFLVNYGLSTWFTFHVRPTWARFLKFATSHAVNYVVQISLFNLFRWLGVPDAWAPLPVYAVAIPVNFLLVRLALTKRLRKEGH
ncbi:MAG: GtrA family protein [Prevotella sp.]|nr:GtrA family protein [Prevotella sp.]